jgi:hypothetical protein
MVPAVPMIPVFSVPFLTRVATGPRARIADLHVERCSTVPPMRGSEFWHDGVAGDRCLTCDPPPGTLLWDAWREGRW